MRFSPLNLAALVPLLSLSSGVSAYTIPVCVDTASPNAWIPPTWWPPLDIPNHSKIPTYVDASLTKKLGDHVFEFYLTVANDKAAINIYNGHGSKQYFRVNFLKANGSIVKSFVTWSKNGGCVSDVTVTARDVAKVTIELAYL